MEEEAAAEEEVEVVEGNGGAEAEEEEAAEGADRPSGLGAWTMFGARSAGAASEDGFDLISERLEDVIRKHGDVGP